MLNQLQPQFAAEIGPIEHAETCIDGEASTFDSKIFQAACY